MAHALEELMQGLPVQRQLELVVHFAGLALPIWEEFAAQDDRTYIDTVVGGQHTISATLPARILALAQEVGRKADYCLAEPGKSEIKALDYELTEPIVALQDEDWELPTPVKLCFYAHSNLLEHLAGRVDSVFGEKALYVAANQAIDAIETAGKMTMPELRAALHPFSGGLAPRE